MRGTISWALRREADADAKTKSFQRDKSLPWEGKRDWPPRSSSKWTVNVAYSEHLRIKILCFPTSCTSLADEFDTKHNDGSCLSGSHTYWLMSEGNSGESVLHFLSLRYSWDVMWPQAIHHFPTATLGYDGRDVATYQWCLVRLYTDFVSTRCMHSYSCQYSAIRRPAHVDEPLSSAWEFQEDRGSAPWIGFSSTYSESWAPRQFYHFRPRGIGCYNFGSDLSECDFFSLPGKVFRAPREEALLDLCLLRLSASSRCS